MIFTDAAASARAAASGTMPTDAASAPAASIRRAAPPAVAPAAIASAAAANGSIAAVSAGLALLLIVLRFRINGPSLLKA